MLITVSVLAVFASMYIIGFGYCVLFEVRMRKAYDMADISRPYITARTLLASVLGLPVVPLVVGIVFITIHDRQRRWETELRMVTTSLEGTITAGVINWREALKVQQAYASAYLPVLETP